MRTLIHNAVLSLAAIMVMMSAATGGWAAERKPNFVFVYSDDHRWDAMGVVQKEQGERARFPWIKTPHMDRLAGSGVRFRNSFVTLSLCAPSRAAFLTGRYAIRTDTHKLVKYLNHPEWTEVFDLAADPYEIKNLAADAMLTGKLEAELAKLVKDVGYAEP